MTAIMVVCAFVLLCLEFLWLYLLSKKQDEILLEKREIEAKVDRLFESVLNAPTASSRENETKTLIDYLGDNFKRLDAAAQKILTLDERTADLSQEKLLALTEIITAINPVELYSQQLSSGTKYQKGYACRRLADFNATDKISDIESLLDNKDRALTYNAAMSLSILGDEDATVKYILDIDRNHKYSYRLVNELLERYSGDKVSLSKRIFEQSGDYITSIVIKAYSSFRLTELADFYVECMESTEFAVKIAAVKAVAEFADPKYEHALQTAMNDKNWVVRENAVKGLGAIGGDKALESLVHAVQDEEWWVRKTAADMIVKCDRNLTYVEKILKGYDKYAADAVKNSLYKSIDMSGGMLK